MSTKESLQRLAKSLLGDRSLVVVSNAEPYVHSGGRGVMDYTVPVGGVASALDPVLRASGGIWIAYGGGRWDWEVVEADGSVRVPPDDPQYTLQRVRLSREQVQGYYDGLANGALWPLCHLAHVRPRFDETDWEAYVEVNRLFAEHVHTVVGDGKALVLVQDYHLALVPWLLRDLNPGISIIHFWHTPWPPWEVFRIFPWAKELLEGLLASDLVAFHTPEYCRNFLETVERTLGAKVNYDRCQAAHAGGSTAVRSFPIGVDEKQIGQAVHGEAIQQAMDVLKTQLGLEGRLVGVGLERADYTKGILERLHALDRFFVKFPQYRERVVFVQVGVPSRAHLAPYDRLNRNIAHLEEEINAKHGTDCWKPLVYLRKDLPRDSLLALYRLADFCIVSSLHDGMNLVAKEFVASRWDEDGVLILSPFTGAAYELTEAVQVNPYATEQFAVSIKTALEMPEAERRRRMRSMRAVVQENNVYHWASGLLSAAVTLGPWD